MTITNLLIALGFLLLGALICYLIFRFNSKGILRKAEEEAEVIKKNKIIEAKEKFIALKLEHENQVRQAEQKLHQSIAPLYFINSGIDYHNLMKMGFLVFYLFFILQYENTRVKPNKVKQWTTLVVTAILIFNQTIIANVSYHKLNMAYEKSYGTLIRIADRIEQTEGAEECDSILVLGYLSESEDYSAVLPPDMTGTTDGYILRADDEIVGQSVLCSALNDYCGKNYKFISGEEKSELLKRIDTDSLNNWPEKNSISVIDNVIVIKLSVTR